MGTTLVWQVKVAEEMERAAMVMVGEMEVVVRVEMEKMGAVARAVAEEMGMVVRVVAEEMGVAVRVVAEVMERVVVERAQEMEEANGTRSKSAYMNTQSTPGSCANSLHCIGCSQLAGTFHWRYPNYHDRTNQGVLCCQVDIPYEEHQKKANHQS